MEIISNIRYNLNQTVFNIKSYTTLGEDNLSKVLIIADGKYGYFLFQKILEDDTSYNDYSVLTPSIKIKNTYKESASLHKILFFHIAVNIHSLEKIITKNNYQHIVVCLKTKSDTTNVLNDIKTIDVKSKISFLNHWSDYVFKDELVTSINSFDILSNRLLNTVPNILNTAQNIGMGAGEIVEIDVPRESSYIYRHLSTIKQRKFSIAGIYRGEELILPTAFSMIHPNDKLLAIGEPYALQNFYKLVNNRGNQASTLKDLFLIIDMQENSEYEIFNLVKKSIRFYKLLSLDHIFIKIIHPTHINVVEKIKKLHKRYISVDVNYSSKGNLLTLIKKQKPSFLIISNNIFEKYKKILYRSKTPVLASSNPFLPVDNFLLLEMKNHILYESISSSVFFFSSKMNLDIKLFTTNNDKSNSKHSIRDEIIEHYQIISGIFGLKITTNEQSLNPITSLQKSYISSNTPSIQTIPFGKDIVYSNKIKSIFMKNSDLLYYKLSMYDQFFLPTSEV